MEEWVFHHWVKWNPWELCELFCLCFLLYDSINRFHYLVQFTWSFDSDLMMQDIEELFSLWKYSGIYWGHDEIEEPVSIWLTYKCHIIKMQMKIFEYGFHLFLKKSKQEKVALTFHMMDGDHGHGFFFPLKTVLYLFIIFWNGNDIY